MNTEIPNGYMQNSKGDMIAINNIKPIDLLRDEQVNSMIVQAKRLKQTMIEVKQTLTTAFADFVALSADEYDTHLGGKKGNVTLFSFDGKYKIQYAISENIRFDERLQVAKQLIDECIHEWSEDSNDNIKALINQAFQVDKEGNISTHRVLALRRINITDEKWQNAMQAIADSIQVTDSKSYMRFYERDDEGKYHQISLDFAKL